MLPVGNQCAVCSEPGKLCAGCKNIRYCGVECQQADWKVHKLLCRTFNDARDAPSPNMVRVIEFPVNETKPKFRWMPIDFDLFCRPLEGDFFGPDKPVPSIQSINAHPKTGKLLPLTITFMFRDNLLKDGSLPNKSVYNFTNGRPLNDARGPVLFYGSIPEVEAEAGWKIFDCVDLDTIRLNVIKDWLTLGTDAAPERRAYQERNSAEATAAAVANRDSALETLRKRLEEMP
ncbi:hypothetical protein QM012_002391 [Aureobasidium pullulans]|uniref:MYND-type domain-containing protein n=1 Tax=Aureobasidium pullulans TaxID=5580 RepID=A0ABR0TD07_AURPU